MDDFSYQLSLLYQRARLWLGYWHTVFSHLQSSVCKDESLTFNPASLLSESNKRYNCLKRAPYSRPSVVVCYPAALDM